MTRRNFSSKELAKALANEIKAEKEQQDDVDEDYEKTKKAIESSFKIIDTPGVAVVQLHSLSGKDKLTITFDCTG
jgi:hypothetical protein